VTILKWLQEGARVHGAKSGSERREIEARQINKTKSSLPLAGTTARKGKGIGGLAGNNKLITEDEKAGRGVLRVSFQWWKRGGSV